jgi:hypothetical protein
LVDAGCAQTEGNRFIRYAGERELVIDVLAPSYESRLVPNQKHGDLYLDEIPGLRTALGEPPTHVEVAATLSDGTDLSMTLLLPDVAAALTLKALAYRGRFAATDAVDIHRLLEAANHAGRTVDDWPDRVEARDAAQILHQFFGSATRPNRDLRTRAARVRALVGRLVPAPG